jgi:hypothetical protein
MRPARISSIASGMVAKGMGTRLQDTVAPAADVIAHVPRLTK